MLNVMRYRYMEGMSAKRQKLYLEMTSKLKTYEKRHTIASVQEGVGLKTEGDAVSESNALQGQVPNQSIEAESQTQQDSAELLQGEADGGRIETEKQNFKTNQEIIRPK